MVSQRSCACTSRRLHLGRVADTLLRYLSKQCRYCGADYCTNLLETDHLVNLFEKSFTVSKFDRNDSNQTHPCGVRLSDGFVKRVIYESLKTAATCSYCHDRTTPIGMTMKEAPSYIARHEKALKSLPRKRSLPHPREGLSSFKEILSIKEVCILIKEWYLRGAWKQNISGPVVHYKTLAGVLDCILGIDMRDVCPIQCEEDWENENRTVRVRNISQTLANIAKKMVLKCYGCGKCFLNLTQVQYKGAEVNHRKYKLKTTLIGRIVNPMLFCQEVLDCDCDILCNSCHWQVTKYQRNQREMPCWYKFTQEGYPITIA
mmetsp:Transcript_7932/g.12315  ORF Transcript_7932/g.12315 Transcript_7932/m.12315 type:complete len:317 (-) Transcript_7932:67-1017(-)